MTTKRAYATTEVPVTKTMDEIHRQLRKYGVEQIQVTQRIATTESKGMIQVGFITPDNGYEVRIWVLVPKVGYNDTKRQQENHGKAEARALFHVIKNKLAGTEYGIETLEIAFLPYLVTASNSTVAERPDLFQHFAQGREIAALPSANPTPPVIALPERTG